MKNSKLMINIKDLNKKNIALLGHMGSGKSLVGRLLSKQLNLIHIDSDLEIEKKIGKTINEIFKTEGENFFRSVEEEIILKLLKKSNIILSLGGGSFLNYKIRSALMINSLTVFLDVKHTLLEERLKKSTRRPLLKNINIKQKIKELDLKRRKYYSLADITLSNNDTYSETISEFVEKYLLYKNEKTNNN